VLPFVCFFGVDVDAGCVEDVAVIISDEGFDCDTPMMAPVRLVGVRNCEVVVVRRYILLREIIMRKNILIIFVVFFVLCCLNAFNVSNLWWCW